MASMYRVEGRLVEGAWCCVGSWSCEAAAEWQLVAVIEGVRKKHVRTKKLCTACVLRQFALRALRSKDFSPLVGAVEDLIRFRAKDGAASGGAVVARLDEVEKKAA